MEGLVERHRLEQRDQLGTEPLVQVDRGLRVQRDEDQPGALRSGQRDQAHPVAVDTAEGLFAVHAEQAALQVIAPCMVGTGQPVRSPGALGHQLATPVPADVDHRADGAGRIAGDHDRRARHIQGLVGTGVGQLAGHGEGERYRAEYALDLTFPQLRIPVVADGFPPLVRRLVRRLVAVVLDEPRHDVERVLTHGRVEIDSRYVMWSSHLVRPSVTRRRACPARRGGNE